MVLTRGMQPHAIQTQAVSPPMRKGDKCPARRTIESRIVQPVQISMGEQRCVGNKERRKATFAIDNRRLNTVTKKNAYGIPQVQAILTD